MQAIALGLESKNPFAYLLLFVILYLPIMAILFAVIDRFKKWRTAMQDLIRGTTPSLIVDFSDTELSVTDITQAVLVITQAGKSRNVFLSDLSVDSEANTISYHFTQAESLALSSGKGLDLQLDVVANGERYRAYKRRITVEDTKYNEVL